MRSLTIALAILLLSGIFTNRAMARDNAVNGMLIGTAVGGVAGYIIGNEIDRDHYDRRHGYRQPVVYLPPPPPPRYTHGRRHSGHGYRADQICRETVVVSERHGRYRESVRTVCRDRDDRHRPHHRGPSHFDRY